MRAEEAQGPSPALGRARAVAWGAAWACGDAVGQHEAVLAPRRARRRAERRERREVEAAQGGPAQQGGVLDRGEERYRRGRGS